jgi:hypothetical protein
MMIYASYRIFFSERVPSSSWFGGSNSTQVLGLWLPVVANARIVVKSLPSLSHAKAQV